MFRFFHWGNSSVKTSNKYLLSVWISNGPGGWLRRSSKTAVTSISWWVTFGALPQAQRPSLVTQPQPPGPRPPDPEPSVAAATLSSVTAGNCPEDRIVFAHGQSLGRTIQEMNRPVREVLYDLGISWANLYLIATHNGYDGMPAVEVNDYSAVKRHLNGFYDRLARRYDKGRTPYNLQNCAYYGEFEKPKL